MNTAITTLTIIAAGLATGQAAVLVGWYDFYNGGAHSGYMTEATGKTADVAETGVTGKVYGASGSRYQMSSTDGTFGTEAGAATAADGAMSARTANASETTLYVTIDNSTGGELTLDSVHFDLGRMKATGPDDITLYLAGVSSDTLINSTTDLAGTSEDLVGDYTDFDWSLSGLALANGESATFKLVVSNADSSAVALAIDNIAFSGIAIPEPILRLVDFIRDPVDGSSEVSIEGRSDTRYMLVEAADLDFANPDQDPVPLTGSTVGTLKAGGVLTDSDGDATIRFILDAGKTSTFIRAEEFDGVVEPSDGPNILFWMADDWGWTELSSTLSNLGNASDLYETPNIDRLANEGIAFTNAYTNGVNCAPTRAALYSGQHPQRPSNRIYMVYHLERYSGPAPLLMGIDQGLPSPGNISAGDDELPGSTVTLAETMKAAGYTTGHFGKYHVGGSQTDNGPLTQGYDTNRGGGPSGGFGAANAFLNGSNQWGFVSHIVNMTEYAQPYTQAQSDDLTVPGQDPIFAVRKNITDGLAESAVDFMQNANDGGQAFFVDYCEFMVHSPTNSEQTRPDMLAKFNAKEAAGSYPSAQSGHSDTAYAALIGQMDQSLGKMIEFLETTPDTRNPGQMLAENTIVVVYSDNGGDERVSDNRPLKGKKGHLDEGGIRVPMLVWSANEALVNGEGRVDGSVIQTIDFYKTFASLGSANTDDLTLDGEDLSVIWADPTASLNRDAVYWHLPGYLDSRNPFPQSVIRKGDWKLLYNYENQSFRLYNLASDIGESNDVSASNPGIVTELGNDLIQWLDDLDSQLATVRPGMGPQTIPVPAGWISYADGQITTHELATNLTILEDQEMPIICPAASP